MDEQTASKIDLQYSEERVIFSICDCTLDKKYSFYILNKEKATNLINRLRYLQKLTWKQLSGLDRKDGLTTEKQGTESYNMINDENTSERKLLERYYFHIRIEKNGLFRVFGYQMNQAFCITHIDPNGKIQHS